MRISDWSSAVCSPDPPPRLMLATGYQDGVDASRYWVSEKLDGVRGRWDGHALWTLGGHRFHAPAWFTEGWPPVPMDGELWLGRVRFEDTSGTARAGAANDPASRRNRFLVYLLPGDPCMSTSRVNTIHSLIYAASHVCLSP